ncbi:hypothetical protein QFC19_003570 [Naganishia cerealis]|uniref:Uncharacterized protein n=1 Tax=Naganishia cerealis TaxID=610337 RepID=A0ACC2W2H4_9TREE|nr:hypothetical protein QFC19_003570 [Naganishia cerealis]
MTIFDHFRSGRLSRQNTRSNPGSASNSRNASPVRDGSSRRGTPPSTQHHSHFTAFFTQHNSNSSSSHASNQNSVNTHSSSKKKEYEFFPNTSPIGSGGYSDVVKASWKARGGMLVAVKVVRKEAVKDHAEYLKLLGPDVKPDNFLYRSPQSDVDDFVIIDFGISKILDTQSEDDPKTQTEVAGTPGYAAPEVFKRTGYGKNQDVFGVGVIAYNILSASSPWKAQEYMTLIQETIRADIQFPPGPFRGVSDQAKSFIKTLMTPDPHQRPSAREALSHVANRLASPLQWLALPPPTLHGQDHVPALPHESNDPDRIPLQRPPTLKPENPIARQITASGIDGVQVLV